MAQVNLLTPLLDEGIRNTNFFNGRLLTAEDLRTEQAAHRYQRGQLGRAIGAGVVAGLAVELIADGSGNTTPVVQVAKGLAINGKGQALELPSQADVALLREPQTSTSTDAGLFTTCAPPTTNTLSTAAGLYVLVLSPASGYQAQAPMSGLGPEGRPNGNGRLDGCGYRYAVEGVQFRLVFVNVNQIPFDSNARRQAIVALMNSAQVQDQARLRSELAHFCFGTENLLDYPRDPYSYQSLGFPGGLLDWLRQQTLLSDCDVPLALIFWQPGGIRWVDLWSVRRFPSRRSTDPRWPLALGGSHLEHGEVVALQFQEQVAWLMQRQTTRRRQRARDLFRYLPAAGIVPIVVEQDPLVGDRPGLDRLRFGSDRVQGRAARATSVPRLGLEKAGIRARAAGVGFDYPTFFEGIPARQVVPIDGGRLGGLLQASLSYPPIDLESETAIQLYVVRENVAAASGNDPDRPGFYIVFASEHMDEIVRQVVPVEDVRTVLSAVLEQQEGATSPAAPTTAISGIGAKRSLRLAEAGINTLEDLSVASVDVVAERLGFSRDRAAELINLARVQIR